jgi:hypothetical protein
MNIAAYVAYFIAGLLQMLRRSLRTIGLPVTLVALSSAQATDATLTLACKGTTSSGVENAKPEPVSMGIIVNFMKRTVQGFGIYPVKITAWNDVTVVFEGS